MSEPPAPFKEVNPQADFAAVEREILAFWKRERVFERSLEKPAPSGDWVFFEGPPTANGMPAIHHVLARAFKDLFPRWRTMQGYRVGRKGGWDTHGLPVEIAVEKKLGILGRSHDRSHEELEEFNRLCRESVWQNIQDWNVFTERLGYWVDLNDPYVTYHNDYIESVWNLLKRLFDRSLVEQDYKVVPLSPRISTTLSDAEVALGYKDVDDPSVYVRFPLDLAAVPEAARTALSAQGVEPENLQGAALLVWTTTPWTLPSNVAVAVHPELAYAVAESPDGLLVVAEEAVERLAALKGELRVLATLPGSALERWPYSPPFPEVFSELGVDAKAHYVVVADYVTAEDGTGLVHQAPVYGAEDLAVARRYGLPMVFGCDDHGIMQATHQKGQFFKDADRGLTRDLRERGLLYWSGTYRHSYPFHDRTGDPILYYAKPSWYIRTQQFRDELVRLNQEINWVPGHIRDGRFGNWLENNVDWAISRERYWGTPLPLWRSEDGDVLCVGSVAELSELSGQDCTDLDLHRPYIDDVVIEKGGKTYRRVPEVLDVWFDSGSMPYAQWHVLERGGKPVDERAAETFRHHFPADFICEAIDQTRGWFYSLHAISTLLYGQPAYKNVVCLGHIQDEHGRKMSKSVGNVVEPLAVMDRFGADAVRWYMYAASEPGDSKRFSERLVAENQRAFVTPLWNVYAFFTLYANLDRPDLSQAPALADRPEIDRWLAARLEETTLAVNEALSTFDARRAAKALERMVDELSNWYVRRNRRRFWRSGEGDADKLSAYAALYEALERLSLLSAPFTPFLAEEIYQNVVRAVNPAAPESVHLADYPAASEERLNPALTTAMQVVIRAVDQGRAARGQAGVKVRQPLPELLVRARGAEGQDALRRHADLIADELNVKRTTVLGDEAELVEYSL
ncbi:MAG TPA: isoleucine--tRNA ligase, partial [Deinococcales bacterium]|nr:isoleucine--tRNA ligase [Deinococcales bacterium]